jgi:hypothetical protein
MRNGSASQEICYLRCNCDRLERMQRKRVLAIVAGILVVRHLKTADDLFDNKPSPADGIRGRGGYTAG